MTTVLQRSAAAPPVRIVHLGLGNFHRAHQAWYTQHARDGADWGIAAFTGRSRGLADALHRQQGLYTLITSAAESDRFELVDTLSAVHPGTDHQQFLTYLRDPETAVLTLTVTEAAYHRTTHGTLDLAAVAADIAALRNDPTAPVTSMPARLLAGLHARRAADAGPLTLLSCDNLPDNAGALRQVLTDLAQIIDPTLLDHLDQQVDIAGSMVDRITPATTDTDLAAVATALHLADTAPVRTEPFTEWVIQGNFPAGRPAWHTAGARFVDDVHPYEQRKLLLLNGAHTLLAALGPLRGHTTVDTAITDPTIRTAVTTLWDDAAPLLPFDPATQHDYRHALLDRFANPTIHHQLRQIATNTSHKIPIRILPVIHAARAAGRLPHGAATTLAAWILSLRTDNPPPDTQAAELAPLATGTLDHAVRNVLEHLDPTLTDDHTFLALVHDKASALAR
jgi:fructuronate reductase